MLTSLRIESYRGFKTYQVDGLSRVNLFVGKNNCGKTALLEGIQFLASGGEPAVLAEVAHRRGEVIFAGAGPLGPSLVDIAHFFHGHMPGIGDSFSFAGDNRYVPVSVKILTVKNGNQEHPDWPGGLTSRPTLLLDVLGPASADASRPLIPITREGGVDLGFHPLFRSAGGGNHRSGRQVRFVGPDSLTFSDLAIMWDEVTLARQEDEVAEAMRVLDREIESLTFLTGVFASGHSPSRGGIVVGMRNQELRVPLGSLGDGMRRMMALATSLAFTKGGCLFVDEIDTGLHYSVMPDMWKMIAKKAVATSTQVFATTHSWDCIEGLSLLCQREPELVNQISIHKIDRALPYSVAFAGESLARLLKNDIDPR